MMLGLVWIMGCYAAGIVLVHLLYWRWKRRGTEPAAHYVLRTYNNQLQMEWYLRSLYFFSWTKGKTITVTIADEGSTDDTLAIVDRLRLEHHLNIWTTADMDWDEWVLKHQNEQVIVIQLNQNEGLDNAYRFL
ncbi:MULTISPECIES: hypothetical protein [unclassified Paenibacillus]|uniref:hypothetical protein n=1 Tax=unclassified Paenibacillus TaxID=185978 RepID=UPI001AE7F1B9|nr:MULTISPECIES: hypothetical protein [unclassified Paenibacillus]MBP1157812.1 glycosyltransferase involved in cell wall biosynthesis [Paenibacillus sp. PvP091]MBP1171452.1 glycosyltransferase involved in cell wall biosynthesis [Paenibacillus sp. PvR098]MBP2442480.1 glycosyltransferase involved in cell wall biosynthesis [Paenibacillus sp. PvP052]